MLLTYFGKSLSYAINIIYQRDYMFTNVKVKQETVDYEERFAFIRWYIRFTIRQLALYSRYLVLIASNTHQTQKNPLFKLKQNSMAENEIYEKSIKYLLDIYIAFTILEMRLQKELPATEGILLVKQRKSKS